MRRDGAMFTKTPVGGGRTAVGAALTLVLGLGSPADATGASGGYSFANPPRQGDATSSSLIAISRDDSTVWSVNPENDSVSVFDVSGDANRKIAEIQVGDEPACVALTRSGNKAFVTNTA